MLVVHPIPPLYDEKSEILILGSFPSVKSREQAFFYGHPQNRFWQVTAAVFGEAVPVSVPEKKAFLHRNHLALWDVIASCEITGSADSTIRGVVPNDISGILSACPVRAVFVNGKTAEKYYRKYSEPAVGRKAVCLPSTSPANAGWSPERLITAWSVLRSV